MKKLIHFPKISFPVVALCFLLPFVTIKCGNYEIAKLNGIDLVTGTTIQAEEEIETVNPNIFVLTAFIAAIAGFAVAFVKRREALVAGLILSVIGLGSLIYFYIDLTNDIPGEGKFIIVISLSIGYYLASLGLLLSGAFYGYALAQKDLFNDKDPSGFEQSPL